MIDDPARGAELDFATSARVGLAAVIDRVGLMLRRGYLTHDDWRDIGSMRDVFIGWKDRHYYEFLDALSVMLCGRDEDKPYPMFVREWEVLNTAFGKAMLLQDELT